MHNMQTVVFYVFFSQGMLSLLFQELHFLEMKAREEIFKKFEVYTSLSKFYYYCKCLRHQVYIIFNTKIYQGKQVEVFNETALLSLL